jgi:hypothetical protein
MTERSGDRVIEKSLACHSPLVLMIRSLYKLPLRLKSSFRRNCVELDDELRFHLKSTG